MPTSDETPTSAMLDAVRTFATDLALFRQEEVSARAALSHEMSEQMTSLRHDVYGSVTYLSQQVVDTKNTIDQQRKDSEAWRATERSAREAGQHGYRVIVVVALVLSSAALIVSLSVAAVLIAKVF